MTFWLSDRQDRWLDRILGILRMLHLAHEVEVEIPHTRQPCCGAWNGSHTGRCDENFGERMTCWCCGGTFPASWTCLWSPQGSRCFGCEGHYVPCQRQIGHALDDRPIR